MIMSFLNHYLKLNIWISHKFVTNVGILPEAKPLRATGTQGTQGTQGTAFLTSPPSARVAAMRSMHEQNFIETFLKHP